MNDGVAVGRPATSTGGSAKSDEATSSPARAPAEHFLFVRPPPSLSNNPLNVQIQLFIPADRGVVTRRSFAERAGTPHSGISAVATATVGGSGALTDSTGLTRSPSVVSNRSIVSTTSSNVSGAGTSTRRVAPLYNLNVHSMLMPTTITDAGTDVKVAKITKRAMEIVGFACLEAAELSKDGQTIAHRVSPPVPAATGAATGAARRAVETPTDKQATNLFNKLKRFSIQKARPAATSEINQDSSSSSGLSMMRETDNGAGRNENRINPVERSVASGYIWSVIKFQDTALAGKEKEVSFEWRKRRIKVTSSSPKRNGSATSSTDGVHLIMSAARNSRRFSTPEGPAGDQPPLPQDGSKTPDSDPGHTTILSREDDIDDHNEDKSARIAKKTAEGDDGSDEDSDPEDSETPWTSDLVLSGRRIRLAQLIPAPFHSKLVAQMQVPGNLTAIEVTPNVLITVEELKDVVACTATWLIVRENLGGIGKKRKGDGNWKLEAKNLVSR